MQVKYKLLTVLVTTLTLIGTFFVVASGYFGYRGARDIIVAEAFNSLMQQRDIRESFILELFKAEEIHLKTFSKSVAIEAITELTPIMSALERSISPTNSDRDALRRYYENTIIPRFEAHGMYTEVDSLLPASPVAKALQNHFFPVGRVSTVGSPLINRYVETHDRFERDFLDFGYLTAAYDVFLITSSGVVSYTNMKEIDFATNLETGPHRSSNLAELFREIKKDRSSDQVHAVDFSRYSPSAGSPAAFLGTALHDGDEFLGAFVLQLSVDKINYVLTSGGQWKKHGLGETGESYIVGEDGTMRNDSRFFIEDQANLIQGLVDHNIDAETISAIERYNTTVNLLEIHTESVEKAMNGESGISIILDYRDVEVLSAYSPLEVLGLKWAIISEIDSEEIFAPLQRLRNRTIFFQLLILGIGAVVLFTLMVNIRNSISTLWEGMRKIGSGQLAVRLQPSPIFEVNVVVRSFNIMAERIGRFVSREEVLLREKLLAQKHAELATSSSNLKSRFLNNINHEVRTPMNSILGFSELLENRTIDLVALGYLDKIKNNGQDLMELINDILLISQIASEEYVLAKTDFDLTILIDGLQEEFADVAKSSKLSFKRKISSSVPDTVFMDKEVIRMMLRELLENAFRETNEGMVKVQAHLEVAHSDDDFDMLVIDVLDSGPGMDEDRFNTVIHLFENRGDESEYQYSGAGTGLSKCYYFSKLMGGKLTFKAREEGGSIFSIVLPLELKINQIVSSTTSVGIPDDTVTLIGPHARSDGDPETHLYVGQKESLSIESREVILDYRDRVNHLRSIFNMDEIEQFGIELMRMGDQYENTPMKEWGTLIQQQVDLFDVNALNRTLDQILGFIDKQDWD